MILGIIQGNYKIRKLIYLLLIFVPVSSSHDLEWSDFKKRSRRHMSASELGNASRSVFFQFESETPPPAMTITDSERENTEPNPILPDDESEDFISTLHHEKMENEGKENLMETISKEVQRQYLQSLGGYDIDVELLSPEQRGYVRWNLEHGYRGLNIPVILELLDGKLEHLEYQRNAPYMRGVLRYATLLFSCVESGFTKLNANTRTVKAFPYNNETLVITNQYDSQGREIDNVYRDPDEGNVSATIQLDRETLSAVDSVSVLTPPCLGNQGNSRDFRISDLEIPSMYSFSPDVVYNTIAASKQRCDARSNSEPSESQCSCNNYIPWPLIPPGDYDQTAFSNVFHTYMNTFPLHSSFANGNLKRFEMAIRQLAHTWSIDLTVRTVLQFFITSEGNNVYLYLNESDVEYPGKMKVPAIINKFVGICDENVGMLFSVSNDPHNPTHFDHLEKCNQNCRYFRWLSSLEQSASSGYYCCYNVTGWRPLILS